MFCNNCGKEIPDNSVFCPLCGNKINLIADNNIGGVSQSVSTSSNSSPNAMPINLPGRESQQNGNSRKLVSIIAAVCVIVIGLLVVLGITNMNNSGKKVEIDQETMNNPIYLGVDASIHNLSDSDIGKVYFIDASFWSKTEFKDYPYLCFVKEIGDEYVTNIYVNYSADDNILEACNRDDLLFFKAVYKKKAKISENTQNEHTAYYFDVLSCETYDNTTTDYLDEPSIEEETVGENTDTIDERAITGPSSEMTEPETTMPEESTVDSSNEEVAIYKADSYFLGSWDGDMLESCELYVYKDKNGVTSFIFDNGSGDSSTILIAKTDFVTTYGLHYYTGELYSYYYEGDEYTLLDNTLGGYFCISEDGTELEWFEPDLDSSIDYYSEGHFKKSSNDYSYLLQITGE
ncbi:zinc ribbon domain-containing protein [Butyrivibrio sp. AD3002]|uniref:zinc ribbon domain-containing protein n=1 Tax=Butyrivibrio sp. AD3002 TaxID=1280670 RepID=UPI0003B4DCCD|nr:zinc ribbon domain-containing protein [Butyrivibrio sp. AD3002]